MFTLIFGITNAVVIAGGRLVTARLKVNDTMFTPSDASKPIARDRAAAIE